MKKRGESFYISGNIIPEKGDKVLSDLKVVAYISGTRKKVGETVTDKKGGFSLQFKYIEPVDVQISVYLNVRDVAVGIIPKVTYAIKKDAWIKDETYHIKVENLKVAKSIWDLWEKICKKYMIFGGVFKGTPDPDNPGAYLDLIPIPDVTVHIYDVNLMWPPLFPDAFSENEIGTGTTGSDGLFLFEFDWCYTTPFIIHPWWWPPFPDVKPDIIFKVTQTVNGVEVPIYEEDASQTRWDIDDLPPLGVSLIVETDAVVPDEPITPITGDFEFHGIGRVLISQVDSEGYADTSGVGDVVNAKDSPFGSAIDIKGQFNNSLSGKYYQVLHAKWANDTTPPEVGDFTPVLDESWPIAQKVGGNWVTVQKTPVSLPDVGAGCYEIPDYTDLFITSKEILIRWRSHRKDSGAARYPDGKYSLKILAFEGDGTSVALPAGGDSEFVVRVDNTWPVTAIKEDLSIIGGTLPTCPDPKPAGMICDNPEVCGIVYIESGKKIRVRINAYDNKNHFRLYRLTYRTGHGSETTIQSKNFSGPPREDYGFSNETVDWEIGGLQQCGYEVRLRVWDRTINGYHHIHRSEDFVSLILLEVPSS